MDLWGLPASEALSIQCPLLTGPKRLSLVFLGLCCDHSVFQWFKVQASGHNLKPVLSCIFFEPVSQDTCFY